MSAEDAFSDEWFARYLLDAVFLVVLVLAAIGIALYLDAAEYLRDWSKGPGPGFLVCMVLCPMLGVATLGLALYAGIRLFLRPRTLGHVFVRLTLLVAHVFVFLVCADTIASTATAVVSSFRQSSARTDPMAAWRAIHDQDFSGPPSDERGGPPGASSSSPPLVWARRGCCFPVKGTPSGKRQVTSKEQVRCQFAVPSCDPASRCRIPAREPRDRPFDRLWTGLTTACSWMAPEFPSSLNVLGRDGTMKKR